MLAATPDGLLYIDRREPIPDNLAFTAPTQEPLYGLDVAYDSVLSANGVRWITLRPIPYDGASKMVQYRYLAQDPNATLSLISPTGSLMPYSLSSGWNRGTPADVSIALSNLQCGTWIFSMAVLHNWQETFQATSPRPPR
jgi:hypothetical protein